MRRRRIAGAGLAILVALAVAACGGYTTPATNVSATQATLNGSVSCGGGNTNAGGTPCEYYWEWGTVASGGYANQSPVVGPVNLSASSISVRYDISGLQPNTAYQFKLCGEGDEVSSFTCVGTEADSSTPGTFTTRSAAPPAPISWSNLSMVKPQTQTGFAQDVSCVSATTCEAVGYKIGPAGRSVPFAEVKSGSSWSQQPVPMLPGAATAVLTSVSCPSTTSCVAAGAYTDPWAGSSQSAGAFVGRWDGSRWTVRRIGTSSTAMRPSAISCTAAYACTVIGSGGSDAGFAERLGSSGWVSETLPPAASGDTDGLTSVSCVSATRCFAIGTGATPGPPPVNSEIALSWNGTDWAALSSAPDSGETLLSCLSATACEAAGARGAASFNGSVWTDQTMVNFAGLGYLHGLSCSAPTACTAVGSQLPSPASTYYDPIIVRLDGSSWSSQAPARSTDAALNGVSCPTSTACTAVGLNQPTSDAVRSAVTPAMVAEDWNGSSWTADTTPSPTGAAAATATGISCPNATECVAVGWYDANEFDSLHEDQTPLVESFNGSSWATLAVPLPAGATRAILNAVSCSAPDACTAVGDWSDASAVGVFAARYDGSAWSVQTVGAPITAALATDHLTGVSCVSASWCVAVGSSHLEGLEGPGSTPIAEIYNGTSWTAQSLDPSTVTLASVSCVSTSSCMAVGTGTAEHYDGSGWQAINVPTQPPPPGSNDDVLTSVSCSTADACGAYGDFAALWDGTAWSAQTLSAPPVQSFDGDATGISCTTATACTVIDDRGGPLGGSEGGSLDGSVVLRWDGATWTTEPIGPGPFGIPDDLGAITCASATSCIAVGQTETPIGQTQTAVNVPAAERSTGATG